MDIVEQLRAESAARHPLSHLAAHEIERLRAALEFYAKYHENPNDGPWGVSSDDFGDVARTALEQK